MASRTGRSNSSKVLRMTAEAMEARCASRVQKLSITSLGSVVRMKEGKSLSLMLFKPGIQSTGVSRYPLVMSPSSAENQKMPMNNDVCAVLFK
ncbi:hypothetical protein MUK42_18003 [Musa troglodytarum]|uniref:Uncharacterized protein n=1 Tax=Musa troglodytarum TaxID=320322 RepID=A0A9E7IHH3_9LILI|nr:hypothetical protein MUK42_18003 [Musa troglodytarum]